MTRQRKPLAERFWRHVDKRGPDECWPWIGSLRPNGYGQVNDGGRGRSALSHRASWELSNGPIPHRLHILHRCDNKACVNPAHLVAGTPSQNIQDMIAKGRHRPARGNASGTAKLTDAAVVRIIALAASGTRAADLAREYGVSGTTVCRILSRKIWRHV